MSPDLVEMIEQYHRTIDAFVTGDPEPQKKLFSRRDDDAAERESIAFDLGQAVENAMLAAWELEIGSCHGSVYDEPRVRAALGYPPEMTCDLVVSFGYPADPEALAPPGSRGGRKPLGDLRHDERFGG